MKKLFALAAIALAAPLTAATPKPWTATATLAPSGSYVIGNPKAKVKLIEYVSYTCPHCAHFSRESAAVLKGKMIASGSTSLEVRSSVHDRYDLVAATLARCSGPALFPRMHDLLFARQDQWLKQADGAGLTAIAKAAGMSDGAIAACFAKEANVASTLKVAQSIQGKISGTPAFELNGTLIENTGWAELEPNLRAVGAK